MARIFISYAREDYQIAKRLYDFLVSQGQEPWLDKENVFPGQNWETAIQSAIRKSHFFIAILSVNSIEKRGYFQKELRAGLEMLDQVPDSQIFLIPVRIDETKLTHERLRELQWMDLFPDWEEGLRRLMGVFEFIPSQILVPSMSGTEWLITTPLHSEPWKVVLRQDSILEVDKYQCGPKASGTWKQSGEIIYMEFNQRYAQYKGVIEGNRITGQAQNVKGGRWHWEAAKVEDEARLTTTFD